MLCLSGLELYFRWVPLKRELKQRRNEYIWTGQSNEENMENEESLGDQDMSMSEDISKNQQLNPSAHHFQACQELHGNDTVFGASNNQE